LRRQLLARFQNILKKFYFQINAFSLSGCQWTESGC
jgi:hypothetical protein